MDKFEKLIDTPSLYTTATQPWNKKKAANKIDNKVRDKLFIMRNLIMDKFLSYFNKKIYIFFRLPTTAQMTS